MTIFILCCAAACSIAAIFLQRRKPDVLPCFFLLTFVLPFAAGGFHGYTIAVCIGVLSAALFLRIRKNKQFLFSFNLCSAAVISAFVFSCLTPLWAADKGMAPFGILRWAAVLLYALSLMQCSPEEQEHALDPVPLCGAVMTAVSFAAAMIPALAAQVTVNGRLAGFFQYPNTFAAFLLAGLVLHCVPGKNRPVDVVIRIVLTAGIVLSGSRTVFILTLLAYPALMIQQKALRRQLLVSLAVALVLGFAAAQTGLLTNADRYTGIRPTSGTFLVRLLYFKDAAKLILRHPFGLGYLGFRVLEGSIQTGRYYVTYVHNGFLQLLLDLGWIPGCLMAAAFLSCLFSPRLPGKRRLLLLLLLGHCMLDYDTEFFSIWIILLTLMDFQAGKPIRMPVSEKAFCIPIACLMAVGIWLGTAELCYYTGNMDLCLKLTPFHTDVLAYQMVSATDTRQQETLADRILTNSPTHALALTAKSNAAFLQADLAAMMEYGDRTLLCSKYNIEAYCSYIDKLYAAVQMFSQSGDPQYAGICAEKIREIVQQMRDVEDTTDPLANLTGDDSSMTLPESYQQLITYLQTLYP